MNGVGKAFSKGLDVLVLHITILYLLKAIDTYIIPVLYYAIKKKADPIDLSLIRIMVSTGQGKVGLSI